VTAHFVDHGLDVLVLARLDRLLGKADVVSAALKIDEGREETRQLLAEHIVEHWPEERLLQAPLRMQQDLRDPMKQP